MLSTRRSIKCLPMRNELPRLLTVQQVADQLQVSVRTVYSLLYGGRLESVKIGVLRRVPADALDRYVASLTGQITEHD